MEFIVAADLIDERGENSTMGECGSSHKDVADVIVHEGDYKE